MCVYVLVFSQPSTPSPLWQVVSAPKISLNVPSKIEPRPPDPSNVVSIATISDAPPPVQLTSPREREERGGGAEEEDERDEELTFISSEELARNRLSQRGIYTPSHPHTLTPSPTTRDEGGECIQRLQCRRAFSETLHQEPLKTDNGTGHLLHTLTPHTHHTLTTHTHTHRI